MANIIKSCKDLRVWNNSMDLVTNVYRITKSFPKEELYGLSNQLRRTAVSIPSNIAEGSSRKSRNEYARFISIAIGSLAELDTQILIAERLNMLDKRSAQTITHQAAEIGKMLGALHRSLRQPSVQEA